MYRVEDATYRPEEPTYRAEDATYPREEAPCVAGDATYRAEEPTHRREERRYSPAVRTGGTVVGSYPSVLPCPGAVVGPFLAVLGSNGAAVASHSSVVASPGDAVGEYASSARTIRGDGRAVITLFGWIARARGSLVPERGSSDPAERTQPTTFACEGGTMHSRRSWRPRHPRDTLSFAYVPVTACVCPHPAT